MPLDGTLQDTSAFDFPVEMKDIYWRTDTPMQDLGTDRRYHSIDPTKNRALVRTDTNTVLGVHGSRYKLRPFGESVERISECIQEAMPDQKVQVKDEVYNGGARMRRSIIFPDLKITPRVGDVVVYRIDLHNSYDGGWAEQYNAWAERLWCLNGCTSKQYSVSASIRHVTVEWKHEDHIESLKRAVQMFFESEATLQRWTGRPVTMEGVLKLFKSTLAYVDDHTRDLDARFAKPTLTDLLTRFNNEPMTAWGTYNAATNWASHPRTRGQVHNVERDRHNRVAKMLKSYQWATLAGQDIEIAA